MGDKPKPFEQPECCPGSYDMHFYCKYENRDHPHNDAWPGYFVQSDQVQTRGEALRQHRSGGWIYHRDDTTTCPICIKALSTPTDKELDDENAI